MTTKTPPRERLVAAAEALFYRDGIRAVGVDRLCDEAHVSKRSLYQHFGSKDEVVVAMLDARAAELGPQLLGSPAPTPRGRILDVFVTQRAFAERPDYRGCPFVGAATELKDREHPGSRAARAHKLELTAYFEDQARQGGAAEPELLAVQLTLLFDGASAYGVVRGGATDAALAAASALLDVQGLA